MHGAYITYVQNIEKRFRGTQLSGMFNADVVDELFHESSPPPLPPSKDSVPERIQRKSPATEATIRGSPARALKTLRIDTKTQINMGGLATEDALPVSWVYYRSQREHSVAYLTKHIIEPYMIEGLDKIMSPKDFGSMADKETLLLAIEGEELVEERKRLIRERETLQKDKAKFDAALKKN